MILPVNNSKPQESIDGQWQNINVNADIDMLIAHFIAKYNIVKEAGVFVAILLLSLIQYHRTIFSF